MLSTTGIKIGASAESASVTWMLSTMGMKMGANVGKPVSVKWIVSLMVNCFDCTSIGILSEVLMVSFITRDVDWVNEAASEILSVSCMLSCVGTAGSVPTPTS